MRYDALAVGQTAESSRTVGDAEIMAFAAVSGDYNPVHVDDAIAAASPFGGRIAHGLLSASFISALLATELPGPGAIYLSQSLRFVRPVRIGDTVTTRVEIVELLPEKRRVRLRTTCRNQDATVVLDGEALVMVPGDSS
ncbi:MAG: MaoC family dehydratase [Gemmatimonadaceae bacterium]|jgi:3-hydroxybutyryl-CoA dehydratase|nr:MaoC family dehydratase [Gemmatimonadaceae bacterium]